MKTIQSILQHRSTHFLRAVIVLLALIALAGCIFALPTMWQNGSTEFPVASKAATLIAIGMYATIIPFFAGLGHALKLLQYIDANSAFSDASVHALKRIKQCATFIAVLYVGGIPLLYPLAQADDAPGLIIVGGIIACAPVAAAVFAAILEKLLRSAIDMRAENELTI